MVLQQHWSRQLNRLATYLITAGLVVLSCGCGSDGTPRIPITGTVELDGKPLDGATLAFIAGGGSVLSTAMTGSDGKFSAKVGTGPNKVSVSKVDPAAAAAATGAEDALMGTEAEMKAQAKALKGLVPPKYSDPNTSGLSF